MTSRWWRGWTRGWARFGVRNLFSQRCRVGGSSESQLHGRHGGSTAVVLSALLHSHLHPHLTAVLTPPTTVDSAAPDSPHSSLHPLLARDERLGVTVLPHASDSCLWTLELLNAATGIGSLSPTQTTRSQHQAAVRKGREEEEAVAASSLSSLSTAYTEDAAADSLSLASVAEAFLPCCGCNSRHAARNKRRDGRLCCVNSFTGSYLLGCECKGRCRHDRCGLPLCNQRASAPYLPVCWWKRGLLASPPPLQATVDPYLPTSLICLPSTSRAVEWRCAVVASSARATAPLQQCFGLWASYADRHEDYQSIARINRERRETGHWIKESWTESQWLDNVPWRFRADLWPDSSYQRHSRHHERGQGERASHSRLPLAHQLRS